MTAMTRSAECNAPGTTLMPAVDLGSTNWTLGLLRVLEGPMRECAGGPIVGPGFGPGTGPCPQTNLSAAPRRKSSSRWSCAPISTCECRWRSARLVHLRTMSGPGAKRERPRRGARP